MSLDLRTVIFVGGEAHLPEGQCLEGQGNIVKLRASRTGTRMSAVSRIEE
jgi:hypothetical protein